MKSTLMCTGRNLGTAGSAAGPRGDVLRFQMTKLAIWTLSIFVAFSMLLTSSYARANSCESLWAPDRPLENAGMLRLKSERLDLQPLKLENADDVLQILNDPLSKTMTGLSEMNLAGLRKHILAMKTNLNQFSNPSSEIDLGIFFEGQLVGTMNASYWRFPGRSGGATYAIGYVISPAFRNRGFAKEALERLLKFLFKEGQAAEVQAYVFPENRFSIQTLETFGFKPGSSPYPKFVNFWLDARAWRATSRDRQR